MTTHILNILIYVIHLQQFIGRETFSHYIFIFQIFLYQYIFAENMISNRNNLQLRYLLSLLFGPPHIAAKRKCWTLYSTRNTFPSWSTVVTYGHSKNIPSRFGQCQAAQIEKSYLAIWKETGATFNSSVTIDQRKGIWLPK